MNLILINAGEQPFFLVGGALMMPIKAGYGYDERLDDGKEWLLVFQSKSRLAFKFSTEEQPKRVGQVGLHNASEHVWEILAENGRVVVAPTVTLWFPVLPKLALAVDFVHKEAGCVNFDEARKYFYPAKPAVCANAEEHV